MRSFIRLSSIILYCLVHIKLRELIEGIKLIALRTAAGQAGVRKNVGEESGHVTRDESLALYSSC